MDLNRDKDTIEQDRPLAGRFQRSLLSALYSEALVLADEARSWFEVARSESPANNNLAAWSGRNDPALRIALSCESLRLTTRIMHVIAWLLMQRAVEAGEVSPQDALLPNNRLGSSRGGDDFHCRDQLPMEAQRLIEAGERLYLRVARMDAMLDPPSDHSTPAVHDLFGRINAAF